MLYLIDGHNLIPKVPGLNLSMLDDERQLVEMLQIFARVKRARVEVYFDKAFTGLAGERRVGTVITHFVRQGIPADRELIARMQKMRRNPQGMIVVTSDRQIKTEASSLKFRTMASEEFALLLVDALREGDNHPGPQNTNPQAGDIDDWLKLFGEK